MHLPQLDDLLQLHRTVWSSSCRLLDGHAVRRDVTRPFRCSRAGVAECQWFLWTSPQRPSETHAGPGRICTAQAGCAVTGPEAAALPEVEALPRQSRPWCRACTCHGTSQTALWTRRRSASRSRGQAAPPQGLIGGPKHVECGCTGETSKLWTSDQSPRLSKSDQQVRYRREQRFFSSLQPGRRPSIWSRLPSST